MDRFDHTNPLLYRYLPRDTELYDGLEIIGDLDVLSGLTEVVSEFVIPRINSLESMVSRIAVDYRNRSVPRRINGQHEGVITIEELFKGYAKRLNNRVQDLESTSLGFGDIVESVRNDEISDLVYLLISVFSVEANIADDIRHHFRSELDEFSHKEFGDQRIGSSTMPHKRNPVEYENIKSLWKAYAPRIISAIMAQITEHQGDSTNEYLVNTSFELAVALSYSTKSLENSLKNLKINV